MPTYKVGNEPLKARKSLREVLCEHCGKIMGKALFTRPINGLTAEKAIELWPYLKVDIKLHESICPSSKELTRPTNAARNLQALLDQKLHGHDGQLNQRQ